MDPVVLLEDDDGLVVVLLLLETADVCPALLALRKASARVYRPL